MRLSMAKVLAIVSASDSPLWNPCEERVVLAGGRAELCPPWARLRRGSGDLMKRCCHGIGEITTPVVFT